MRFKRTSMDLEENLLVQDDVSKDLLEILEYAGFSGDGGQLYMVAAAAASVAGDRGKPVRIAVPRYTFTEDELQKVAKSYLWISRTSLQFKVFRDKYISQLEDGVEGYAAKQRPELTRMLGELVQSVAAIGSFLELREGDPSIRELAAVTMQHALRYYEGFVPFVSAQSSVLSARRVLSKAKVGKFSNTLIIDSFFGERLGLPYAPKMLDEYNTFIKAETWGALSEAVRAVFKSLEIRSRFKIERGRTRGYDVIGDLGHVSGKMEGRSGDMEFLTRRPSRSPVKLSRASRITRKPVEAISHASPEHREIFDNAYDDAAFALYKANRRALRKAGVKDMTLANLDPLGLRSRVAEKISRDVL
jgi:hypothetical protein